MRKILIIIFSFVYTFNIFCADIKIALIGTSEKADKIVDLTLSQLSKDKELALLERESINKILKEHRLAGLLYNSNDIIKIGGLLRVDVFAVLRTDGSNVLITVFDAKTAVKLTDGTLLPYSIEDLATSAGIEIKNALEKFKKVNYLRKIILFSSRNVELPRSKDKACGRLADKLINAISDKSNCSILAGGYISLINNENTLTKFNTKLAQSSYLFIIDFYNSKHAHKAIVKVILTIPGKKGIKFTSECNLVTMQFKPEFITDISKYMKKNIPDRSYSVDVEAKKYYSEYIDAYKKRNSSEALLKIELAYGYDNSNETYKKALVLALKSYASQYGYYRKKQLSEDEINDYLSVMERLERLNKLFNYKVNYGFGSLLLDPLMKSINGFDPRNGNHWKVPEYSKKTSIRIADYHKSYVYNMYCNNKYDYWIKKQNKIKRSKELRYFLSNLNALFSMRYMTDQEYHSKTIPLMRAYLKITSLTPEKFVSSQDISRSIRLWNYCYMGFKNLPENSKYFKEYSKISQDALKHPWLFMRLYGAFGLYLAGVAHNTSNNPVELDLLKKRISEIYDVVPSPGTSSSLNNLYNAALLICQGKFHWVKIPDWKAFRMGFQRKIFEIMREREELYDPLILALINGDLRFIEIKRSDILEYIKSDKFTLTRKADRQSIVKAILKNSKPPETDRRKPDSISILCLYNSFDEILDAAITDSGRFIYWVSIDRETGELNTFCYDYNARKMRQLGTPVKLASVKYFMKVKIAIGKNKIAVLAADSNQLIVYDLINNKAVNIKVPFKTPESLAFVENRLFVWCHKDANLIEYTLPSLAYKMIISNNRRSSASDPFDGNKLVYIRLFSDEKFKRLLLLVFSNKIKINGLWYYYPDERKFTFGTRLPFSRNPSWNRISQNGLLLNLRKLLYRINLSDSSKELLCWYFSGSPNNTRAKREKKIFEKNYKAKAKFSFPNFASAGSSSPAAIIIDNSLWSNYYSDTPWYRINLKTGKIKYYTASQKQKTPMMALCAVDNNKKLLAVNSKGVFLISLPRDK